MCIKCSGLAGSARSKWRFDSKDSDFIEKVAKLSYVGDALSAGECKKLLPQE